MASESNRAPVLSVVVPAYNEAEHLTMALERIIAAVEEVRFPFELICVDDGSEDETHRLLDQLAARETRLVSIRLSRNFGKEAAILAGLDQARGEAVIVLDADLQHPPELIPRMVEAWRNGADIVEGIKNKGHHTGLVRRLGSVMFHQMIHRAIGSQRTGGGASDFKLLDRQVVDALLACPERLRFFRGLVAWVGFRVESIQFDVEPRTAGQSKWSTIRLARYAIRNYIGFTSLPLILVAWFGLLVVALGGLLGVHTLYVYLKGEAVSGFTTVILLSLLLSGTILVALGVIATYLAQLFEETKQRPIYIIRHDHTRPPRPKPDDDSGTHSSEHQL